MGCSAQIIQSIAIKIRTDDPKQFEIRIFTPEASCYFLRIQSILFKDASYFWIPRNNISAHFFMIDAAFDRSASGLRVLRT